MSIYAQVAQLEGVLAAASGMVEGTVERVKFKAANGYTVLRMNAVQACGQPPNAQASADGAKTGIGVWSSMPACCLLCILGVLCISRLLPPLSCAHSHGAAQVSACL